LGSLLLTSGCSLHHRNSLDQQLRLVMGGKLALRERLNLVHGLELHRDLLLRRRWMQLTSVGDKQALLWNQELSKIPHADTLGLRSK
jgi:5-keto 4-deoxyuronate isomerase